jgi:hypothetical protein
MAHCLNTHRLQSLNSRLQKPVGGFSSGFFPFSPPSGCVLCLVRPSPEWSEVSSPEFRAIWVSSGNEKNVSWGEENDARRRHLYRFGQVARRQGVDRGMKPPPSVVAVILMMLSCVLNMTLSILGRAGIFFIYKWLIERGGSGHKSEGVISEQVMIK